MLADRGSVGVETEGVAIDLLELRRLVRGDLAKVPTETLEAAATRYRGNVLEGHECSVTGDRKAAARFAKEVERIRAVGAAAGTRDIAARLAGKTKRAARTEAL